MKPNTNNLIDLALSEFEKLQSKVRKQNGESIKTSGLRAFPLTPSREYCYIFEDYVWLCDGLNVVAKFWISRQRFVCLKYKERRQKFYRDLEQKVKSKIKQP